MVPETLTSSNGIGVGNDVLIDGDYIYASTENGYSSVYVYKKSGSAYSKIAVLKTSVDAYYFGIHLTIQNNTLAAAGMAYPSSGEGYYAAFLFTKSGEWTDANETVQFKFPDGMSSYNLRFPFQFISSTEIVIAVLVKEGTYYTGKIVKFTTADGTWQDLFAPVIFEETDLSIPAEFGKLMSAVRKNGGSGYTFRNSVLSLTRSGGLWGSLQKVTLPRKSSSNIYFGTSIVKTGDPMFAGAPYDGTVGRSAGAVYIYHRVGEEFEKFHTIYPSPRNIRPAGGSDAAFGYSIAVSGDELAIGAP